ncbi:MAG TPA: S-layer homology domain-containing protein [Bacilli bacterium]|nr:S-layer homology domain-containing protein [Bacilli bacterium]
MALFERYELQKQGADTNIILYLNENRTEFAQEPGRAGADENLQRSVREYVRQKFPNKGIKAAKIMLGTVLIATVPLAGTAGATDNDPTGQDTGQQVTGTNTGTLGTDTGAQDPNNEETPAIQFTDIDQSYAKEDINRLVNAEIIVGYDDQTFRPLNTMTRQDFAIVLARALDLETDENATPTFTDVSSYAAKYVAALQEAGLAEGLNETTFGAQNPVTREQMATFYIRAMGLEDAAQALDLDTNFADKDAIDDWAKPYVGLAAASGFLKGFSDNTVKPTAETVRQDAATFAARFYFDEETFINNAATVWTEHNTQNDPTITEDNQAAYVITGTALIGTAVSGVITDANDNTVEATADIAEETGEYTLTFDTSTLAQGDVDITLTFADADGNTLATATDTVTKETEAVTAPAGETADTTAPALTVATVDNTATITADEQLYYKDADGNLVAIESGNSTDNPDLLGLFTATGVTITAVAVDNNATAPTWTFTTENVTDGATVTYTGDVYDAAGNQYGDGIVATYSEADGNWTIAPAEPTAPADTAGGTTP